MTGQNIKLFSFVGEATGKTNVCNVFSEKYQTLHNSVSFDMMEMKHLKEDVLAACYIKGMYIQ